MGAVLEQLPRSEHPDLLVGFEHHSDAGVFRLSEGSALVQSVDFFTPIVDDPADFGAIAAANALSDLYAIGARPLTAMALVCFPQDQLPPEVLVAILTGGATKVREAGAVVVGGHSVRDPELKYGLAVTGLVDPARMRGNTQARPGDALILTKPLGTGYVANAVKGDQVAESDPAVQEVVAAMKTLNAAASEVFSRHAVRACTDVTGFGLLGHARALAEASGVALTVRVDSLPVHPLALTLAARKALGGGSKDNELAARPFVDEAPGLDVARVRLAFDPQTSGGLLAAVPPAVLDATLADLRAAGVAGAVIGVVREGPVGRVALEA